MWVDSSNRNNGIGKQLFNSHRNWAKRLNLKCIKLWVKDSAHNAKPFYSKIGFIETGTKKPHNGEIICEMRYEL